MKNNLETFLKKFTDLPPLFFRLVLSYAFIAPAWKKLTHFSQVVNWFSSIGLPFPGLLAALTTVIECLAIPLLFLGIATRTISFFLMLVMFVAVTVVYWPKGFKGGFEIELYYLLMLFSLFINGPGKYKLSCKDFGFKA